MMTNMIDVINKDKQLIEDLEECMNTELSQVECTLKHHFSNGVYVREITMPTGALVLGHEHTTTHLNIISKGACVIIDMDTKEGIPIQAPFTFESGTGVRKLLYITEECVWSTVHVTDETDIETLESTLVKESPTHIKFKEVENWHMLQ